MSGIQWDESVHGNLQQKVNRWLEELHHLQNIHVPRCLRYPYKTENVTLHVFNDASESAYGSVAYAVHTYHTEESSSVVVASKGRVAPIKVVSIPRLELMAAIVGLKFATAVVQTLQVPLESVFFWTDSANVLGWVQNHSRTFKPFVANRISEIQTKTNPSQWKYVPTSQNPADILSRGIPASKLIDNDLWWHGPHFLVEEESEWPEQLPTTKKPELLEKKAEKSHVFTVVENANPNQNWRLDRTRFSDWQKLKRLYAWVYRFLDNCMKPQSKKKSGDLMAEEIESAEMKIIARMQKTEFREDYQLLEKNKPLSSRSKLLSLNPKLDPEGVMRLGGRLALAEHLSPEAKYPIILPRKNWVTKLIVRYYHEMGKHVAGTNHVLTALSAKYWVVSGREEIREWENECAQCKKLKAKPAQQIMAPLPKLRLTPSLTAFSQVGIDFGGPFLTVQGRGRSRSKRYLGLFTCLVTRGVHLEIAFGLDTDSFLNAFYRMVNRRGLPEDIVCDNGTNFVGAVAELKALVSCLNSSQVQNSLANKGSKWHFNPPSAPHFGGAFEAMIKSAKRAVYAILSTADVTDEELMTAFTGAESLINSRPLTYQSSHPNDDIPLTPCHFMHGQVGGVFAPESVDSATFNPRKRWRRIQDLVLHFWKRWMKEWVPSLNRRQKWLTPRPDLKVGDVVLVISPHTSRGHWPMGRIERTYPGSDSHVRVVDVRVGQSLLSRPITKVCHLEFTEEDQGQEQKRT